MKYTNIVSCHIGPDISPENFISEHIFVFLLKGKIEGFDGHRKHILNVGECCLITRNSLARYSKYKYGSDFEKVVAILDAGYLRDYMSRYKLTAPDRSLAPTFIDIPPSAKLVGFIESLEPGNTALADSYHIRDALLSILLNDQPGLYNVLFDFHAPGKADLQAFIHQNYKFKASLAQLAHLSGRSLSAFKRDFYAIFGETPGRWLTKRRLDEARFLLEQQSIAASDLYLELGFENLSHFSHAYKKRFGYPPSHTPNGSK